MTYIPPARIGLALGSRWVRGAWIGSGGLRVGSAGVHIGGIAQCEHSMRGGLRYE